jgi:dihydrofolate reductase
MIAAIVAVDGNNGIGFDGELLERIPEDMRRFRALTEDNIVIMGRKTWDSLPSQPLQNRDNLIISSKLHLDYNKYHDYVVGVQNMESAKFTLTMLKQNYLRLNGKDVFIIGGGSIYEQLLPYCDTIYMTRIDVAHENVDTYFPHLDLTEWSLVEWSDWREYNGTPYRFLTYKRV